jgi:hypothetical protein
LACKKRNRKAYQAAYWANLNAQVKLGYRARQRAHKALKLTPEAKAERREALALRAAQRVIAARRKTKGMVNPTGERPVGPCEICGVTNSEPLLLDHSHVTGYIRGWLCRKCNSGLGFFNDNNETLRKAAEYLERTI